jgi:hypothetical protein
VTTDVASNELLEALIHADELALMRMGERPRDPDVAKHWTRAHDARRAELERLRRRRGERGLGRHLETGFFIASS